MWRSEEASAILLIPNISYKWRRLVGKDREHSLYRTPVPILFK